MAAKLDLGTAIRRALQNEGLHVVDEVLVERRRQDEKWGEQNHPDITPDLDKVAPWADSVAHYLGIPPAAEAQERTDADAQLGVCSWAAIAVEELCEAVDAAERGDTNAVRTEVVQLAAVCVQWVQAIDRRKTRSQS